MKKRDALLLLSLIANIAVTGGVTLSYQSPSPGKPPSEGYLFTFAQISDTQFPGSSALFERAASWLADQSNISFVVHTGDIVNNPFDETAWENAYKYMHQLDKSCQWAVLAGDNDVLSGNRVYLGNFNKYFGVNSTDQYFVVEGELLFILFSWTNRDGKISQERLEWMDEVIRRHENLYVVISLHAYPYGYPFLDFLRVANADEVWNHIDKHDNVIMTLSGHTHANWVRIHVNRKSKVWSISTEALAAKGYVRLFDVYEDKIEVYAYSPWTNEMYIGALDRFAVELNPSNWDVDGDLWSDSLDIMPTHPMVPNIMLVTVTATVTILAYWVKGRAKDAAKGTP